LAAGATITDSFTAVSSDGSASQVVTVTIHGTNDVPTLGGTNTGSVTEDGTTNTGGTLTITDVDTGESTYQAQSSVAGTYGTFNLAANGVWTYTLNNSAANVQALSQGQIVSDSLVATSFDGSATRTITVTIHGADDGAAPGSILTVTDTCEGGTALLITGTSADDTIVVAPGAVAGTLQVTFNGVVTIVARPSGRIIVTGGDGNDNIQVAGAISNSAWLYGDAGNDRLNAGNVANHGNLLIGGAGNDDLLGGSGRDILIGGMGADKLIGNASDDILIAGYTTKDDRSSASHEAYWCAILDEWSSGNSFAARINNLKNGTGGNAHNAGWYLLPEVRDDGDTDEVDMLNGGAGYDWLIFASGEDKVVGQVESSSNVQ
jgi:VCBS repeat-containing protein